MARAIYTECKAHGTLKFAISLIVAIWAAAGYACSLATTADDHTEHHENEREIAAKPYPVIVPSGTVLRDASPDIAFHCGQDGEILQDKRVSIIARRTSDGVTIMNEPQRRVRFDGTSECTVGTDIYDYRFSPRRDLHPGNYRVVARLSDTPTTVILDSQFTIGYFIEDYFDNNTLDNWTVASGAWIEETGAMIARGNSKHDPWIIRTATDLDVGHRPHSGLRVQFEIEQFCQADCRGGMALPVYWSSLGDHWAIFTTVSPDLRIRVEWWRHQKRNGRLYHKRKIVVGPIDIAAHVRIGKPIAIDLAFNSFFPKVDIRVNETRVFCDAVANARDIKEAWRNAGWHRPGFVFLSDDAEDEMVIDEVRIANADYPTWTKWCKYAMEEK